MLVVEFYSCIDIFQMLQTQFNELSAKHKETLTELTETQNNSAITQTALEKHQQELTGLHEKYKKVSNDLKESVSVGNKLTEELNGIKDEKDKINQNLLSTDQEFVQLKSDYTTIADKLKVSDSGLEETRKKFSELQETHSNTVSNLESCKQELSSSLAQLNSSRTDIQKLETEIDDIRTKLYSTETDLQGKIVELKELGTKFSQSEEELAKCKGELETTKENLQKKEKESNEHNLQLQDLQKKHACLAEELNKATDREKELNNSFDELSEVGCQNVTITLYSGTSIKQPPRGMALFSCLREVAPQRRYSQAVLRQLEDWYSPNGGLLVKYMYFSWV